MSAQSATSWQLPRLWGSYGETRVVDFGHYTSEQTGISRQITAAACYRRSAVASGGVARKHFTRGVDVGMAHGKQKRRKREVDDVEQVRNVANIHLSRKLQQIIRSAE